MPQSLSKLFIHLTFSTKKRIKIIDESIEIELWKILGGTLKNSGSQVIKVGGWLDHVHILLDLSRTANISKIVEIIKTTSRKWIKTKGDRYNSFYWQDGYPAFSVNPGELDKVITYIENQKIHHTKVTFKDECQAFFIQYKVNFDEKYVWD